VIPVPEAVVRYGHLVSLNCRWSRGVELKLDRKATGSVGLARGTGWINATNVRGRAPLSSY
jgi:hypothetical protein